MLLSDLKARIGSAQVRAAVAVNTKLVTLYWHVGSALNERVQTAGWGAPDFRQQPLAKIGWHRQLTLLEKLSATKCLPLRCTCVTA